MNVSLNEIITTSPESVISKLQQIYDNSFPPEERVPFEWLIHNEHNATNYDKRFTILGIFVDNEVCGMLSFYKSGKYIFGLYFATDAQIRNSGIGGQALKQFQAMFPDCLYVYEVEKPIDIITKRRIAYYERNNIVLRDYGYAQPPLRENDKPLPMMFGSYPRALTDVEATHCTNILYKEVYRVS
jgi:hypothetical protein